MMVVKRDNVERIVDEVVGKRLIADGWKAVETVVAERDLSKFKVPDLKALCDERGIDYETNANEK